MTTIIDDGNTRVWHAQINPDLIEDLYEELSQYVPWKFEKQTVYGKECNIPRGMYFYGDDGVDTYRYSKLSFPVENWTSDRCGRRVRNVRNALEYICSDVMDEDIEFDSCLINYYRDGQDYIADHKDKEVNKQHDVVATVSLGTSRKFVLKNKKEKEEIQLPLYEGDVVIMTSRTGTDWTHGIPRVALSKCSDGRISLTFRVIN